MATSLPLPAGSASGPELGPVAEGARTRLAAADAAVYHHDRSNSHPRAAPPLLGPTMVNSKTDPADTVHSPKNEPRLPPGQVLTEKWPVLHYGSVPTVDMAKWDLRVFGLVEQPVRWTYAEFMALPQTQVVSDIHCVTRWSRYDNRWRGVSFPEVMRHVRVKPEARFAVIHAEQGFTANLPLAELNQDDVLFAHQHDGVDLTPEHGWPLRLVVPRRYFWKSAKWVRAIEMVASDQPGFWERNGYHNEADPWREERFSDW